MNDDILVSLVENYKQKNVSMHDLLKDPIFLSLPLEKQIQAVQAYAGVLQAGGKKPSSGKILAKSTLKGFLSGLLVSVPSAVLMKDKEKLLSLIGATAGAGGVLGGLTGAYSAYSANKKYNTLNKYLSRISSNDINNSIEALRAGRGNPVTGEDVIHKVTDAGPLGKPLELGLKVYDKKYDEKYGVK